VVPSARYQVACRPVGSIPNGSSTELGPKRRSSVSQRRIVCACPLRFTFGDTWEWDLLMLRHVLGLLFLVVGVGDDTLRR
jgi:hypothetical protein